MDDFRTSYATSGQVIDLWKMVSGLQAEVETLTARLERLQAEAGQGSGSAGSAGSVGEGAAASATWGS